MSDSESPPPTIPNEDPATETDPGDPGSTPTDDPSESPTASPTEEPTDGTTEESTVETSTEESTSTIPTTTAEISTTSTTAEPTSSTTTEESSTTIEETSTTETSTTAEETFTTTTTSEEEETSTTSEADTFESTTFTTITSDGETTTQTNVVTVTNTRTEQAPPDTSSAEPTETATPIDPSGDGDGGLPEGGKVAIGVVVPIVAIAIIAIVGLFFWKKRKARLAAEEERRKEVEDYSYNPNADPTYPPIGGVMGTEGGYEMREDGSSGYRGWGTTLAGSTGRKASTTMSGGGMGAYSDATSPTQANASLARPDEAHTPEGEILGAMGPSANNNRGTGVNRGPSNASSSYSAAGRSDGSDGAMGVGYGGGATYYDQQNGNPYSDNPYGAPQEMPGAPVIRDNPARRNTRIENPSHYPQQSAGISQNF